MMGTSIWTNWRRSARRGHHRSQPSLALISSPRSFQWTNLERIRRHNFSEYFDTSRDEEFLKVKEGLFQLTFTGDFVINFAKGVVCESYERLKKVLMRCNVCFKSYLYFIFPAY